MKAPIRDFQSLELKYSLKNQWNDAKIRLIIDKARYTELEVVSNIYDHVLQKRRTIIKGYDKKENKWVYIKGTKVTNARIQKQYYREMMLGYELDYKHIVKVSDNWFTIKNQDLEEAFMAFSLNERKWGNFYSIDYLTKPNRSTTNNNNRKMGKNNHGYSDLRFTDWLQIAHQLIKDPVCNRCFC